MITRRCTFLSRLWVAALALLLLAGCSRAAALGEAFSLREGETARVGGTGLTLAIEQIGNEQPGLQETMDGFVFLQVTVEGEGEGTVYLEVGERERAGGYEIHLNSVVSDGEGWRCELVVTR
jgi:hypothetical protein